MLTHITNITVVETMTMVVILILTLLRIVIVITAMVKTVMNTVDETILHYP